MINMVNFLFEGGFLCIYVCLNVCAFECVKHETQGPRHQYVIYI